MKAKRRGTFVHTQKPDRAYPPGHVHAPASTQLPTPPSDSIEGTITTVSDMPVQKNLGPPQPEVICPHGGIYLGKILLCALCEHEDSDELFGFAVMNVAKRAAWRVPVVTSTFGDCVSVAVMELIKPKNRNRILAARVPDAMALKIAKDAIMKMYRSRSMKSMPVGWMKFPGDNTRDELGASERLEIFTTKNQTSEIAQEWQNACYNRVRTIPGVDLLWTDENFRRLQLVLDEAKRKLPTKPFQLLMLINMRLGLVRGDEGHEYSCKEIADHFELTERQARYAYQKGLDSMKEHIVGALMPQKRLTSE